MGRMKRMVGLGMLMATMAVPTTAQRRSDDRNNGYYNGMQQGYRGGYNDQYDHRRYDSREEYNRTHGGIGPGRGALIGGADGASHSWTAEQLLTSTVHEAWMMSGRNEDRFFEMVKELAAMSAQKRGLTLPETDAAGKKAGDMIKREARKDPDQLLYAVVDRAVMKTGTKTAASTN
jgi:hypothetical protein